MKKAQAALIMGSPSDLKVLQPFIDLFKEWEVPLEVRIVSAHRTPDFMMEYAKKSEKRGLKVIAAAAGGAAHLPGMTASCTRLPVIGIPVVLSRGGGPGGVGGGMKGLDALLSIAQMPRGVPVACVAAGGAGPFNGALLALKILSLLPENKKIKTRLSQFQKSQKQRSLKADTSLKDLL